MRMNGAQTDAIEQIWYAGDFTGDNKPTARATIHKGNVRLTYDKNWGDLASIIFSVGAQEVDGIFTYFPREIPNIKSVDWNRDVDTDIASATIVIYNTSVSNQGVVNPGAFTWNRGDSSFDKARGITHDPYWYGMLVPDNVIRTFEGYGADFTAGPELDPHLLCTGNWLIDKVVFQGGLITVTARDFGRILSDQILFPPITPRSSPIPGIAYPISFDSWHKADFPYDYTPLFCSYSDSSNTPWVGHDGYQLGHYAREAMDGNQSTYWLSVGNAESNASDSFEWIEAETHGETIGSVNVHALYPNMKGYVSIHVDLPAGPGGGAVHGWIADGGTIPYTPGALDNGAGIDYVTEFITNGLNQRVDFWAIPGVTKVRLTFTNLQDSGVGPNPYRAGVREFGVYSAKSDENAVVREKGWNYGDFTDIVKLLCAWGGFHWPKPSDQPYIALSRAPGFPKGLAFELNAKPANDNYLKNGRVWGDFEQTGTFSSIPLTIDQFDKKTILDAITMIANTVGFMFMIDESGGAVWRAFNYYSRGNRIQQTGQRVQRFIRILDTQTLQDIAVTLDSHDARERNYVATPDGKAVGSAKGYNLNPIGLRRIAGWIDFNWTKSSECQMAAELMAIQQMMKYRMLSLTIAALPTIQVDDQVEVVDTATGEGYLHYVRGIHSTLDHSSGQYTFQMTTSWLGARAGTDWAIAKKGQGGISADAMALIDYYDKHRKDGAYDAFAPVTLPSH